MLPDPGCALAVYEVDFEGRLAEERLAAEDKRERDRAAASAKQREAAALAAEEQRRRTELLLKERQLAQDQVCVSAQPHKHDRTAD